MNDRTERDSMGEVRVPADAKWGAQTQRAVDNFRFSNRRLPGRFIRRLALVKAAAAHANKGLGVLDREIADRVAHQALAIAHGEHADQFPVDLFQTGSGTSTNMNMNEVIARLSGPDVHPNDHVNRSQSSNDVIPTTMQLASALEIENELLPALREFTAQTLDKAANLEDVVKTGRTHLMDAMPLTIGQELSTWAAQIEECSARIEEMLPRLKALPLGGTAIGTGVNCPPGFSTLAISELTRIAGSTFTGAENLASRMGAQDVAVECSGVLKTVAVALVKIANDLRWMSSGPVAGLGEIALEPLQPGSSIMPGKVNPVLPEAVAMISAEVTGNDVTITVAAQSGNFQLNVMLPLIAEKLLTNIDLLARGADALARTITGFTVNHEGLAETTSRNPILITALTDRIGYDAAAAIAKRAYEEGRAIIDVAEQETDLSRAELEQILDPLQLAKPHRTDR